MFCFKDPAAIGGGTTGGVALIICAIICIKLCSSNSIKGMPQAHKATQTVFERYTQTRTTKKTQTKETCITKSIKTQTKIPKSRKTQTCDTLTKHARQTQTTQTLKYAWKKTEIGEKNETQTKEKKMVQVKSTYKQVMTNKDDSSICSVHMVDVSEDGLNKKTTLQDETILLNDIPKWIPAARTRTTMTQTYASRTRFKQRSRPRATQTYTSYKTPSFEKKETQTELIIKSNNIHKTRWTQTDAKPLKTKGINTEYTPVTQPTLSDEVNTKPELAEQMSQAYTMYSQHNVETKTTQTDVLQDPKTKNNTVTVAIQAELKPIGHTVVPIENDDKL